MAEYIIQPGDTFYRLAQRLGGTCEEWKLANPGINPDCLQIGQKVYIPVSLDKGGKENYTAFTGQGGTSYSGDCLDEVEMEVEGVTFKIRRLGESKVPHEIQLTVPRTEIRKVQPYGPNGPCEIQIMLSNVNLIHSPRLMSDSPRNGAQTRVEVQNERSIQGELAQIRELRSDVRPDQPIF